MISDFFVSGKKNLTKDALLKFVKICWCG